MRRTWALVGQQANHFTCDTLFDQHNHHFMCDTLFDQHNHHFTCDTLFDQHNPPYSFAMRIDVPLKSDDKFKLGNTSVSAVWGGHSGAPPPPPPSILPHSLAAYPGAVCIDGRPGTVYANASTTASTTWVIQLGPGNGGAGASPGTQTTHATLVVLYKLVS